MTALTGRLVLLDISYTLKEERRKTNSQRNFIKAEITAEIEPNFYRN